jgi:signal-transduction protein with cAMP-binding, CBS, and nucleotidyltransferase domain
MVCTFCRLGPSRCLRLQAKKCRFCHSRNWYLTRLFQICHLVDGDYFGEIALLVPKQKRIANIIALETCQVYKLERKSFKKVMEANKDLYRQILDQAKLRHSDTKEIERMFIKKFEEP